MMPTVLTYRQWLDARGETHTHCPLSCEHPQPFVADGRLYCGRCAAYGAETEMVACTPDVCG